MPIDPRIALGVQPVQMPNFLEMAGQFANVRQSQAAEQNNLALLAQRQREERDIEAVRNYMSSPGFNAQNPNLIGELGRLAPTQGPALAKGIFDVRAAEQAANKAALETSSATNTKSLQTIASFDNPLQAWANIAMEERKGLDPQKAAAVRQSLKQAMAAGPTGFRDWQVSTLRKLLPVEEQLKQQFTTVSTGREDQIVASPALAGGGRGPEVIFRAPKEMSDKEKQELANANRRLNAELAKIDQDMLVQLNELEPVPGMPGMFENAQGQIVAPTFSAPNAAPEATKGKDGYRVDASGLHNTPLQEADSAMKSRSVLRSVGYGTKDFDNLLNTIRSSPSGLGAKLMADAKASVGVSDPARQALSKLEVIMSQLTFAALQGKLGSGVSNIDVQLIKELSGAVGDPTKTVADRLAAFEEFTNVMRRVAYLPDDGYDPFTGRGSTGTTTAPRTLSGTNLTVPTPPGQGTVTRAPPPALSYTPEEADAALRKFGVIQ